MGNRKTNRGNRLRLEAQLKGVRAALQSRRTPTQLREGLRKRAAALEKKLARRNGKDQSGLLGLGFLGL